MSEVEIWCTCGARGEGRHPWEPGEWCPIRRPVDPAPVAAVEDARQQIPYMLENTPEEFQRVRNLAWPSPAPVAAEGTDELREALARKIGEKTLAYPWRPVDVADALLAGPLAPLLAKLQAVEALADEYERRGRINADPTSLDSRVHQMAADRLRRALGGESR